MLPEGLLQSFIQNGVISGVGSVIVFLPQILILFLFILLLEDFGYMARAAFLMDRIMGGAGLHGRAFIPLLSSFACAIPGIMATRVIDNQRDRLTTILVAPLMTCSARIPVYTLIISAFIPDRPVWGFIELQGLVMFGLYAAGIVSALGVSFVANHFFWRETPTPPFMLELPDYKMPRPRSVAIGLYTRAKMFLQRAGTTIFSMMVLIWFLASFPRPPAGATGPAIDYSLAAMHRPLARARARAGRLQLADQRGAHSRAWPRAKSPWPRSAPSMRSKAARKPPSRSARPRRHNGRLATALALLAWYIFAPQCASTLAVIKRETGSWKLDGGHLWLHAGAGLYRGVDHLPRRGRVGCGGYFRRQPDLLHQRAHATCWPCDEIVDLLERAAAARAEPRILRFLDHLRVIVHDHAHLAVDARHDLGGTPVGAASTHQPQIEDPGACRPPPARRSPAAGSLTYTASALSLPAAK